MLRTCLIPCPYRVFFQFVTIRHFQLKWQIVFLVTEKNWYSLTSPYGHLSITDSSFAPRNTKNHTFSDTSVKRTLGSVPLFSVLKRLDCIGCRSISTKTDHLSAVLTASHRPLYTEPFAHLENNKKIKVCLKVLFSNGACSFMHMLLGKCHHFFLISLKSGLTYCS